MKILIISDAWHPQINGVVRTYEHILPELETMGHSARVIGPADFPRRTPLIGYSEIELALWPSARLGQMIRDWAPDAIHIATEGTLGWAARRLCMRENRPFTTAYHTHFPDYIAARVAKRIPLLAPLAHRLGRAFVRHFHKPAIATLVSTPSLESDLRAWGFVQPLCRMTRGVDFSVFYPAPAQLFGDLERPVALYVGRVSIEKNLEAFLEMPWAGDKVIVGDGPARAEMMRAYPKAHFVGKKTTHDLADHYRSADVFVFPSRTDTFGMVLIEALACGLPVAGFDVTGPKDILSEAFLGATHPHDLSQAAHVALTTGTPALRHAHAEKTYTWRKAAEQFVLAFKSTKPDSSGHRDPEEKSGNEKTRKRETHLALS